MRNKIIWTVFFILLSLFLLMVLFGKKNKEYIYKVDAFDTVFYLKFITDNPKKASNIKSSSEEKILKLENLVNRKKHINGLTNLYDIRTNNQNDEYLKLDKDLYNLLEIGLKWYKISNYVDIGIGNIVDAWNDNYKNQTYDIPNIESDIKNLELKNGQIKNNHLNLYLDDIVIGYLVDEIGLLFKKEGIKTFFINTDSVVLTGSIDDDTPYKAALKEPNGKKDSVYQYISLKNAAYTSIDFYNRIKRINHEKYTFYINPVTKTPVNDIYGTTVISKSALTSTMLSLISFYSKDSKELLNNYDSAAIWYYDKDHIEFTDSFKKYQLKQ